MIFKDRRDAGKKLAKKLEKFKKEPDLIVLGLPRGGVVTADEIASELKCPLDIVVPRKIRAPFQEELAIGAISEDGEVFLDDLLISNLAISSEYIEKEKEKEKKEAQRRLKTYRGDKPKLDLKNKIVILIDDGIATGLTMLAAIASVKKRQTKKIIIAVPITPPDTIEKIKNQADEFIYLDAPVLFFAIGNFYKKFDQTEDEEVIKIMKKY